MLWIVDVSLLQTRGRSVRCSTCRGQTTAFLMTAQNSSRSLTTFANVELELWSQPLYTAGQRCDLSN